MHKEVLRAIAGIDVFPVISLVLFLVVFSSAIVRALCLDRRLVERLSLLPLDGAASPPDADHPAPSIRHSTL
jgi:hypothetical protein